MKKILFSILMLAAIAVQAQDRLKIVSPDPLPNPMQAGVTYTFFIVHETFNGVAPTYFGPSPFAGVPTVSAGTATTTPANVIAPFAATFDVTPTTAGSLTIVFADGALTVSHTATVLPVEISRFVGTSTDNNVNIEWTTASELNNDYFIVQRSFDGTSFEDLTKIDGAGNSTEKVNYSFTDRNINAVATSNTAYYRLKQTDFNGDVYFSDVITVALKAGNALEVNNVRNNAGEFAVIFNSPSETDVVVNVVDLAGRTIFTQKITANKGNNQATLDMTSVGNGIFVVTLDNGVSTVAQKFVR